MYPYLCMQKYLCMHYMPCCVLCQILYSNICTSHVHMDMYTRPLGRLATEGYLPSNPDSDVQSLSQFHVGKWVTPRTHTHTDLQIYIYRYYIYIYKYYIYNYIYRINYILQIHCRQIFCEGGLQNGQVNMATCGHLWSPVVTRYRPNYDASAPVTEVWRQTFSTATVS